MPKLFLRYQREPKEYPHPRIVPRTQPLSLNLVAAGGGLIVRHGAAAASVVALAEALGVSLSGVVEGVSSVIKGLLGR